MFREPPASDSSDEIARNGDLLAPRPSCGSFDPAEAIEQVKRVFSTLEQDLVGLRPLLIQSVYALLTRENLLIFSPPGTAKTFYASAIFSRIRGARIFDTQMSKGTLAEELFGSIDTEQLKGGRIVHNTRGTLVDADLAFIDEFFDANDMVRRAQERRPVGSPQTFGDPGLGLGPQTMEHIVSARSVGACAPHQLTLPTMRGIVSEASTAGRRRPPGV